MSKLLRREFLMLAHTFKPAKHGIAGWYMSHKIDGQRAFWDGGISRGMPKADVPWANTAKDGRYQDVQIATGLWSRYGNVIHAPDWWLDKLPAIMLDGELDMGGLYDGRRQDLRRVIAKLIPGPGWRDVHYRVFDLPTPHAIFVDGRLSSPNFTTVFEGIREWEHGGQFTYEPPACAHFSTIIRAMQRYLTGSIAIYHPQLQLPWGTDAATTVVDEELERYTTIGGEGLILRKPESSWIPKRMHELLKVKKLDDAEATVVGYVSGRATDKGSKLLGLMGAMVLNYHGKRLELSGFTDEERQLTNSEWAENNPGQEIPEDVSSLYFPRGTVVTFKYRGLSKDGIPCEARYWRRPVQS